LLGPLIDRKADILAVLTYLMFILVTRSGSLGLGDWFTWKLEGERVNACEGYCTQGLMHTTQWCYCHVCHYARCCEATAGINSQRVAWQYNGYGVGLVMQRSWVP